MSIKKEEKLKKKKDLSNIFFELIPSQQYYFYLYNKKQFNNLTILNLSTPSTRQSALVQTKVVI